MSPQDIEEVLGLLQAVSSANGHPPIGEHRWLDLVQGGRQTHCGIIAGLQGHTHGPIGYAQLSGEYPDWSIDLAIHPHHLDPHDGPAIPMIKTAIDQVGRSGGGHVHLWVPKPEDSNDLIAELAGLSKGRDLLQLRRSLPLGSDLAAEADEMPVRQFRPGQDEEAWLQVNNRAFAWHPEQGGWTSEILYSREKEPWFDPKGFLLYEIEHQMAGFCWTKIHADQDPPLGEIYVIAVDPNFQGTGLGRRLTLSGLRFLENRNLKIGMLYVDSTNKSALSLYTKLGFSLDHIDRAYVANVPALNSP